MSERLQVLLVDDRESALAAGLRGVELELIHAEDWPSAVEQAQRQEIDVVVLHCDRLEEEPFAALDAARRLDGPPEVVMLTASPTVEEAVEAVRRGAFNYLDAGVEPELLQQVATRAGEGRRLRRENSALRRIMQQTDSRPAIVADSAAMREVMEKVERIAPAAASVLIYGETGAGKGLVARAIHEASPRHEQPFVHLNCGALQEELLESELFGHEKGAFTGAGRVKPGLFEVAHGGTLFLDEIAELTAAMQAKLLQVLDSGELRRVGGTRMRKVDARVLAATNKSLKKAVRDGSFRQDLFFRLNVVHVTVPPLRDRKEDMPRLVELFLERFRAAGQPVKQISRRALSLLLEYHWPGNVRELANTIESVSLLSPGGTILPQDLPPNLQPAISFESRAIDVPLPLVEMERLHIIRALDYTGGKKAPAARLLRIDVKTLSNKIKSYGIEL